MNPTDAWLAGRPHATLASYRATLRDFARVTGTEAGDATRDQVAAYRASITEQANGTQATKLAILSSLYEYMVKAGWRDDNPMSVVAHRPKVDKEGSVEWLTIEEQRALIASCDDPRDLALIWTLLHGLRLSEVVGLNVDDYANGSLRFVGKGSKARIVPLVAPAREAITAYIGTRRRGPLFLGTKGRIGRRSVQRYVQRLAGTHPHALRHSAATRLVTSGMGLPQLQRYLGHAALSSTQLYTHIQAEDVADEIENKDPLNERKPLVVIEGGMEDVG